MPSEYDISRAFKRIENDLMDSMMRNLRRHQVEEKELGMTWEQWQAIQLRELEQYRIRNADKFTDDFRQIDRKVDALYRNTSQDAQAKEEARLLDKIKKRQFTPDKDKGGFFNLNEGKLEALIMATQSDFARAEFAMLRRANDQYRKIIFDSMTYANVTNDYKKAVDMATHDFLKAGINCVVYKNGARHTIADYASMALRTGNKRAYLMGEGNAHDRYGLHTVRVNNRTDACPLCVGFLGKLLIDDVYGGGTQAEANQMGIPTLSDAMLSGFLHPNCKDMYSVYIEGVSKPAKPWDAEEIEQITEDYNTEQKIKYAQDTADTYTRMAKYSLDPDNVEKYEAKAKEWQAKADELRASRKPVEPPVETPPTVAPPKEVLPLTDEEKEALEWYVSGEGMWINQYMRGNMEGATLSETEQQLFDLLKTATDRPIEVPETIYRSVDARTIFSGMSDEDLYRLTDHLIHGDGQYDKGAYSQGIKARMEKAIEEAKGKEVTEKGFMSTTVDKRVAEEWGYFTDAEHPVVLELDTKGVQLRGADLDFLDIAEDPQRERLLAPNVRYKITDIGVGEYAEGGKYVKIKAEIVGQGEAVAEATVAPALATTEAPQDIDTIKKTLEELDKAKAEEKRIREVIVEHMDAKAEADIFGQSIQDVIEERKAMYPERAEVYQRVLDNLEAIESGTYGDDIKGVIAELEKKEQGYRADAFAKLKDKVGFEVTESEFADMPTLLLVENSEQLATLEEKFGAVGKSFQPSIRYKKGGGSTNAQVSHMVVSPESQWLTLFEGHYGDTTALRESRARCLASRWSMPCLEREFDVYTVTHEYGHMIHNIMLSKDMESFATFKTKATTYAGRQKAYQRLADKTLGAYRSEIIEIAKTLDPNFDIMKELSRYGMTNNAEFFAEVFANSQLGAPNTLGRAMTIWLKGKWHA